MSLLSQPHDSNTQARSSFGLAFLKGIRRLFNVCIDLIFPPRCAGCGRLDTIWCEHCQSELQAIPVYPCIRDDIADVVAVAATGWHEGLLREAVQGLKYGNAKLLGAALGTRLAQRLQTQDWMIDTLIPVPLHAERLKERGYNQAQIVCEAAAAQLGLPCVPQALTRVRYSHSQVGLSARERMENVADAFMANAELVSHRTILLVDDVCTTGSTLSACAAALLEAGAQQVYGLTITTPRS